MSLSLCLGNHCPPAWLIDGRLLRTTILTPNFRGTFCLLSVQTTRVVCLSEQLDNCGDVVVAFQQWSWCSLKCSLSICTTPKSIPCSIIHNPTGQLMTTTRTADPFRALNNTAPSPLQSLEMFRICHTSINIRIIRHIAILLWLLSPFLSLSFYHFLLQPMLVLSSGLVYTYLTITNIVIPFILCLARSMQPIQRVVMWIRVWECVSVKQKKTLIV